MDKWDRRFIDMAKLVGSWSKDDSTQVGCVIVRTDKTVASLGFNGLPRTVKDHWESRDEKLAKVIHAEENAILFSTEDLSGCTAYLTHAPCISCAAKLVQAGVGRVMAEKSMNPYWPDSTDLFHEAGVSIRVIL